MRLNFVRYNSVDEPKNAQQKTKIKECEELNTTNIGTKTTVKQGYSIKNTNNNTYNTESPVNLLAVNHHDYSPYPFINLANWLKSIITKRKIGNN